MALERPAILAIPLDFDGCVFNSALSVKWHDIKKDYQQKLLQVKQQVLAAYKGEQLRVLTKIAERLRESSLEYTAQYHRKLNKSMFASTAKIFIEQETERLAQPSLTEIRNMAMAVIDQLLDGMVPLLLERQKEFDQQLILCNEPLVQHIEATIAAKKYERVIFLSKSGRQSRGDDYANSGWFGSSFPALFILHEQMKPRIQIPSEVYPWLLADAYGNRPLGENFMKAVEEDSSYQFSYWHWDKGKATIYYWQTHQLASKFPDHQIDYHAYDDIILSEPATFYTRSPELLPENVHVNIFEYKGAEVKLYMPDPNWVKSNPEVVYGTGDIQGTGVIDRQSSENIRLMVRWAGGYPEHGGSDGEFSVSERLSLERVIEFKARRLLSVAQLLKTFNQLIQHCEIHPIPHYKSAELQAFMSALYALRFQIQDEVQSQQRLSQTEEDILQSPAIVILRESMCMLYWVQAENIWHYKYGNGQDVLAYTRRNALSEYAGKCGQESGSLSYSTAHLWANVYFLATFRTGFMTSAWNTLGYLMGQFASIAPVAAANQFFARHANQLMFSTTTLGSRVRRMNAEVCQLMRLDEEQVVDCNARKLLVS